MENFFTAILIFDVNEFIFVCVVTTRFVCDGKICVLNYLLTRTCKSKSLSLTGRFNCITSSIKFVGLLLYFYFGEYKIYKKIGKWKNLCSYGMARYFRPNLHPETSD